MLEHKGPAALPLLGTTLKGCPSARASCGGGVDHDRSASLSARILLLPHPQALSPHLPPVKHWHVQLCLWILGDPNLSQRVAVKVLNSEAGDLKQLRKLFWQECVLEGSSLHLPSSCFLTTQWRNNPWFPKRERAWKGRRERREEGREKRKK